MIDITDRPSANGAKLQGGHASLPAALKDTGSKEALVQSLERNFKNQIERRPKATLKTTTGHSKVASVADHAGHPKPRFHNKSVGTDGPPGDQEQLAAGQPGIQPRLDHKGFVSELEQLLLTNG